MAYVGISVKVALTALAAVIESVHVLVPVHPPVPPHPVKVDPALGVAVRVTEVPEVKAELVQFAVQLKPEGDDETVPEPVPAFV